MGKVVAGEGGGYKPETHEKFVGILLSNYLLSHPNKSQMFTYLVILNVSLLNMLPQ